MYRATSSCISATTKPETLTLSTLRISFVGAGTGELSLNCTSADSNQSGGERCTSQPITITSSLLKQIELSPNALSMLDPNAPSCTVASFYAQSWTLSGFQYIEYADTYSDSKEPIHPAKWQFEIEFDHAVKLIFLCQEMARPVVTDVHICIDSSDLTHPSLYRDDIIVSYTLDMEKKAVDIFMSWTCADLDPDHP